MHRLGYLFLEVTLFLPVQAAAKVVLPGSSADYQKQTYRLISHMYLKGNYSPRLT